MLRINNRQFLTYLLHWYKVYLFLLRKMSSILDEQDFTIVRRKRTETDLIAPVLEKIISWGCTKSQNTTFHEHIKSKYGDELENLNRNNKMWVTDNLNKLNKCDCSDFDVTFLNSLIPIVCDRITFFGTNAYKTKCQDPTSLESLLKKAKDARNKFAHESVSNATQNELDDVNQHLEKLLNKAASVYNKDQQTLEDAKTKLQKEIVAIGKKSYSSDWSSAFIKQKIRKGAISELKETWGNMSETIAVPLMQDKKFSRKQVYSQLKMTSPDATSTNGVREVKLDELVDSRQSRFALIKGPPGAGKTVLSKHLMDLHLEKAQELKKDVVLHIYCRTANQGTVGGLLEESLSKTLCFIDEKDVADVAPELSITFIIDGYDEANKAFKKILRGLFSKKCPNWSFLISSRPQACGELEYELRRQDFGPIVTVKLEPLSSKDEKREFMSKFMNEHPIEGVDASYLDSLPNEEVKILNSPVLMCLFYALLARGKGKAPTLKNEATFFSAVFEEIKKDMSSRIEECCKADKNPRHTAVKVLNFVSKLSLEVFSSDSYLILPDRYDAFISEIESKGEIQYFHDIDFTSVLSCILSRDEKGRDHFWHTSMQEFLAARFIILKLEGNVSSYLMGPGPTNRPASEFDANPFFSIIMDACNSSSLDTLKRSVLLSF